uniref:Uncharacterized protein n=1 Tax=Oryzias latipes TaxID=8090 RepID=A0A3P9L1K4_ORYLA
MSLRAFIRTFWCICSVSVSVCLKTLKDELWSVVFVEFNDVSNGNSACGDFGISVLDCPTGEGNLLFLINSFFYVFVFLRRNWTPQAILYLKGARRWKSTVHVYTIYPLPSYTLKQPAFITVLTLLSAERGQEKL